MSNPDILIMTAKEDRVDSIRYGFVRLQRVSSEISRNCDFNALQKFSVDRNLLV